MGVDSGVPGGCGRTLSSASENPRPARTRRLYFMVGQRTMGLSLSTGRGARAAALERRALRRRDLRPGYISFVSISAQHVSRLRASEGMGRQRCRLKLGVCGFWWGLSYLVEVCADTTLPILAEICKVSVCGPWNERQRRGRTIVLYLLVVLDRL